MDHRVASADFFFQAHEEKSGWKRVAPDPPETLLLWISVDADALGNANASYGHDRNIALLALDGGDDAT